MHRVTNLCDTLCLEGVIAVLSIANQLVPCPNRVNDLSQIRRKRNDAIDFIWQADTAAGFVRNFASLGLKSLFGGRA